MTHRGQTMLPHIGLRSGYELAKPSLRKRAFRIELADSIYSSPGIVLEELATPSVKTGEPLKCRRRPQLSWLSPSTSVSTRPGAARAPRDNAGGCIQRLVGDMALRDLGLRLSPVPNRRLRALLPASGSQPSRAAVRPGWRLSQPTKAGFR